MTITLPVPNQSITAYLESNAPNCLQEVLAQPRRLPTLESWSTYGENCLACYYHIPKAEENAIVKALALLLINTNLYSIDLPYEHGYYDFSILDIRDMQANYEQHSMRELSVESMRATFRGFLDSNLAQPEKSFALDGKPVTEAQFLALNPLAIEEIRSAYAILDKWNQQEYFVETGKNWVYWFWWVSI